MDKDRSRVWDSTRNAEITWVGFWGFHVEFRPEINRWANGATRLPNVILGHNAVNGGWIRWINYILSEICEVCSKIIG